ncbi:integrase family protein [Paenibacillus mucilaginosus 3016]|uniref:Integrase family protein n=1 Tax=Paenibacillus mucilaginosus 3016 TaxID=1116391 RepID=H6NG55_9BACL|nr:site-specific integrase [Paenibacillus mucilaginosus]AFC32182.1 integrase family protein [Paenibacillus mucilaginosus 3016]WFA20679.1 site-specific integrase [Paenibacillus mucilaginosus]
MAVKLKGTIRERGDKFEYVIDVGRHPVTGKRMQETGTRATYADAEQALIEINRNIQLGQNIRSVTLGEFITRYYEEVVKYDVRPPTFHQQMHMVSLIIPKLGDKRIDKISYDDIENLYKKLLDEGRGKATIKNVCMVLRKTFKHAMIKRLIMYDVAKEVKPFAYRPPRMNVWLPEQVNHFLMTMKGTERHAFYSLAFSTGMRIGEITGLYHSDITPQTNEVHVRRALKKLRGVGLVFDDPKTENSIRSIEIHPKLTQLLLEIKPKPGTPVLFTNRVNKPMDPKAVREVFQKDIAASKLPPIRFHDIRHTVATTLLASGIPVHSVAEILGDKVETVLTTYAHVLPKMRTEAAHSIHRSFFEI